jgi:hypothetical protein
MLKIKPQNIKQKSSQLPPAYENPDLKLLANNFIYFFSIKQWSNILISWIYIFKLKQLLFVSHDSATMSNILETRKSWKIKGEKHEEMLNKRNKTQSDRLLWRNISFIFLNKKTECLCTRIISTRNTLVSKTFSCFVPVEWSWKLWLSNGQLANYRLSGQIQVTTCFCMVHVLEPLFTLNDWKRILIIIFNDFYKVCEIWVSVSLSTVSLEHSMASHSFVHCLWLLLSHRNRAE